MNFEQIHQVAMIGAGTMGSGMSMCYAQAGYRSHALQPEPGSPGQIAGPYRQQPGGVRAGGAAHRRRGRSSAGAHPHHHAAGRGLGRGAVRARGGARAAGAQAEALPRVRGSVPGRCAPGHQHLRAAHHRHRRGLPLSRAGGRHALGQPARARAAGRGHPRRADLRRDGRPDLPGHGETGQDAGGGPQGHSRLCQQPPAVCRAARGAAPGRGRGRQRRGRGPHAEVWRRLPLPLARPAGDGRPGRAGHVQYHQPVPVQGAEHHEGAARVLRPRWWPRATLASRPAAASTTTSRVPATRSCASAISISSAS